MGGRTLLKVQMGSVSREMGLGALAMNAIPRAQHEAGKWTGRGQAPAWGRRQREAGGQQVCGNGPGSRVGWCDPGRPQEGPQEGIGQRPGRAALGAAHLSSRGSVTPSLPCISVGTADHPPSPLALLPTALPQSEPGLARGRSGPWSLQAGVARPAASPDDRCLLSPLPPTPRLQPCPFFAGPTAMGGPAAPPHGDCATGCGRCSSPSGCCLPGWSVCTGVVALLTRLPGPPAPEPARSSCPRSVPDLPP